MQDVESLNWTYGGSYFVAEMWGPSINDPANPKAMGVRIWPRLGELGTPEGPTKPLGPSNGGMYFPDEATARAYIESWEHATGGAVLDHSGG